MKKLYILLALIILAGCIGCNHSVNENTSGQTQSKVASKDEVLALRGEYFDFAIQNRLDYVPVFEEGSPPAESKEYLYFAFAINLNNWGDDKGIMTRDYVEEVIKEHFEVKDITHTALKKGWNYDGEKYVAVPMGIKEEPIFILKELTTYTNTKNDEKTYKITLDCCTYGGFIPSPEEMRQIRANIMKDDLSGMNVISTETFSYYVNPDTMEAVFTSHMAS